jgi:hypothetical protein
MAVTETIEQYQTRLAAYVENRDPVEMQRDAPRKIASLIRGIAHGLLARRPAPDRWSVVEIIAHLAEDELTSTWRYRQMIEHDGVALVGFNQDLWARLGKYGEWSAQEALEMFRLLREANVRMLSSISEEQWERSGVHAERGKITVRSLARHMAAHDVNHIRQIERILG